MYLNGRAHFIAGMAMVLMALSTAAIVALTAASGVESDPFDRGEVATFLTDLADHQSAMIAAGALGLFSDALLALVVAATLFVLFRDRSAVLAPVMLVAVAAAGTMSAINDILNIVSTVVAEDFVRGGATGVASGDAATLELGRILGILTFSMFTATNVAIGLAFVALGSIIAFAPKGALNPPRWLGWVAIVSAAASWLSPLVFANDALFLFFPAQLITMLVLFIGLGAWLMMHSEHARESATRSAAAIPEPAG